MKNPRKTSFMTRPSERYDGIILQVRKTGQHHVLTVFTKQQGLISILLRSSRKGKQGFGALMALSTITFDAVRQGDVYTLSEYDCHSNKAIRNLTLDNYVYSQLFVEMVRALVPPAEPDNDVYRLLQIYTTMIAEKPIRLVTLIAGWQLVGLAGFGPDVDTVRLFRGYADGEPVYYLGDDEAMQMEELHLTPSLRHDWQAMMNYAWGQQGTVHFTGTNVTLLEHLLYQYVEQCSERKLQSLTLWRQLKST